MNWDCAASGYAASNGSTGDETIWVDVGSGNLTINVTANGTTPSIRTSGAIVTVVENQVTLTLTGIVSNSEVRIYSAGTTSELAGIENSSTTFGYTYSYVPSTTVDIVIHNVNYVYYRLDDYELGAANSSLPISQIFDRNYSNP
jgi:hypothetical protein